MGSFFDVEQYRQQPQRQAVARAMARPTLVLGSTQRPELVATRRAEEEGVDVVRRRGGGGAVLLRPGDHLWIDAWVPRDDPLWSADVSEAAVRIGAWWRAALGASGVVGTTLHEGRSVPGELGALVCFAGRGPGEVFSGDHKIVGLSQWRGREGALFSACAYTHWNPAPLMELIEVEPSVRTAAVRDLLPLARGLRDLDPARPDLAFLGEALLSSFPRWPSGTPA